jgi:hypothetical protein
MPKLGSLSSFAGRKARDHKHVTVHGRGTVVVLSEEEYSRLSRARSGQQLVDLLGASPLRDIEIEHPSVRGPVRDVDL